MGNILDVLWILLNSSGVIEVVTEKPDIETDVGPPTIDFTGKTCVSDDDCCEEFKCRCKQYYTACLLLNRFFYKYKKYGQIMM